MTFHHNQPLELGLVKSTKKFMESVAHTPEPPEPHAADSALSMEDPPFAPRLPAPAARAENVVSIDMARVKNFDRIVKESKNPHGRKK